MNVERDEQLLQKILNFELYIATTKEREREWKKKQKREIEDKRLNSWFACAENLMQMSAVI